MKKLILSLIVMMACVTVNAQEPEKKKDAKTPTRGQERAINESGVSVKAEPKKKSSSKAAPTTTTTTTSTITTTITTTSPEEKKPETIKKDVKKPE